MARKCNRCGIVKLLTDFHKKGDGVDNRSRVCKQCINAARMARYYLYRDHYLQRAKELRSRKPKTIRAKARIRVRRYRRKNPGRCAALQRKARENPKVRLNDAMARGIWGALRGRKEGRKWLNIVQYDVDALVSHLESLFQPGMNWNNYGKWHIDHIIPVRMFSFSSPDDPEFQICWSLENLRPMWADENMQKGRWLRPQDASAIAKVLDMAAANYA